MAKYTHLACVSFEVPAQYFSHDMKVSDTGGKNLLWQIRTGMDSFIYTISDNGVHHVLTDEGVDFVREKIVESKL